MHRKNRDEAFLKEFGKNLSRVRREQGFTQESLAHKSGLSLSQIARIETGQINATICTINIIAKALGVETRRLF